LALRLGVSILGGDPVGPTSGGRRAPWEFYRPQRESATRIRDVGWSHPRLSALRASWRQRASRCCQTGRQTSGRRHRPIAATRWRTKTDRANAARYRS